MKIIRTVGRRETKHFGFWGGGLHVAWDWMVHEAA